MSKFTEIEDIENYLRIRKGYLKKGAGALKSILNNIGFNVSKSQCDKALKSVRKEIREESVVETVAKASPHSTNKEVFRAAFLGETKAKTPKMNVRKQKNGKNVLVIGDLHLPFCLDGYLEHCIAMYKQYKCNEVVFIGDIIDNHASSYHETDPDGMSAGEELSLAIEQVKGWYKAFPKATVCIGNHDRLIMRKAYSSGLSQHWIRSYSEVLGVPGWDFVESIEIDDVLYIHGEGGTAERKSKSEMQSTVQGHLHSECYVKWSVGSRFKVFGMQVGCGIDHKKYAFAYAKAGKKPAIACGVVLKGLTPINLLMNL